LLVQQQQQANSECFSSSSSTSFFSTSNKNNNNDNNSNDHNPFFPIQEGMSHREEHGQNYRIRTAESFYLFLAACPAVVFAFYCKQLLAEPTMIRHSEKYEQNQRGTNITANREEESGDEQTESPADSQQEVQRRYIQRFPGDTRVRIPSKTDDTIYEFGKVSSFDPLTGQYVIRFDDGQWGYFVEDELAVYRYKQRFLGDTRVRAIKLDECGTVSSFDHLTGQYVIRFDDCQWGYFVEGDLAPSYSEEAKREQIPH